MLPDEDFQEIAPSENYFKLLEYEMIFSEKDLDHGKQFILLHIFLYDFLKGGNSWTDLDLRLKKIQKSFPNLSHFVPVLDLENCDALLSEDEFQTLIVNRLQALSATSLIVINVSNERIKIIKQQLLNEKSKKIFWRHDQFFLFYPIEKDSQQNSIYFSEIFGGGDYAEYRILSTKLISTHITSEDYTHTLTSNQLSEKTISQINNSPLFINDAGIVQNFEVVIKSHGKTLFEYSMEFVLNTDYREKKNDYFGYLIKDSHFRLGSKIHIRDFVYAKRIFQNSFFANRFAFLIAKQFLETYADTKSLTIIGYGMYSQLLINRVEKILLKKLGSESFVNHDMVGDSEDPRFLKHVKLHQKVLIIVPINTTFSTTIKIEKLVRDKIKACDNKSVLLPSVNLILVTHGNFEDKEHVSNLNDGFNLKTPILQTTLANPYKVLNWTAINADEKWVQFTTNAPNKPKVKQSYVLAVPSELYLPESCPHCFPNDPLEEKILLETDKASVTPDLLLDLPQHFLIRPSFANQSIIINDAALVHGHTCFKGNHFSTFVQPENFFNEFQVEIEEWAKIQKEVFFKHTPDILSSGVLLISSGNRNNIYFTDFINRHIFDDSGVIIHYDIAVQGSENFKRFFSAHVWQAKYIFYVDDIIQGGDTFLVMNDMVRFCNAAKDLPEKRVDGVFTLICKSYDYVKTTIIANLNSTFVNEDNPNEKDGLQFSAFYFLNIDPVLNEHCPLCETTERYKQLGDASILDSIKHYFYEKALKLRVRDISEVSERESTLRNYWHRYHPLVGDDVSVMPWRGEARSDDRLLYKAFIDDQLPDKRYLKNLVQHIINKLLSEEGVIRHGFRAELLKDPEERLSQISELFVSLLFKIKDSTPFLKMFENAPAPLAEVYDHVLSELIIKVLSEYPFNNVKCIREKVFHWVLLQLDLLVSGYQEKTFDFSRLRKIKFLMKRAATLGANYLLSTEFLRKILLVHDNYRRLSNKRTFGDQLKADWKVTHNEIDRYSGRPESKERNNYLGYLNQRLRNIRYVEASVREFGYFFISVIKDVTQNNEAKTLKLEQNIDEIFKNKPWDGSRNFQYYLRLLKFENVSIIRKGSELIYKEYLRGLAIKIRLEAHQEHAFKHFQDKIDKKLNAAFDDYRLLHLKKFLRINNYYEWKRSDEKAYYRFLQFLYLFVLLENEDKNPETTEGLETKTQAILQNFFRVAGHPIHRKQGDRIEYQDDVSNGAFLVLKHHDGHDTLIRPQKMVFAQATAPLELQDILFSSVDEHSLSYVMINGVSDKDYRYEYFRVDEAAQKNVPALKKPWLLWELSKDESRTPPTWHSSRGQIFPLHTEILKSPIWGIAEGRDQYITDDFTEILHLPTDTRSLKLLRLSSVTFSDSKITNDGRGVIGIYSNRGDTFENGLDDVENFRMSLVLLPIMTRFLNKHYDSSILDTLISAKARDAEKGRNRHGHEKLLVDLINLSKDFKTGGALENNSEPLGELLTKQGHELDDLKKEREQLIEIISLQLLSGAKLHQFTLSYDRWREEKTKGNVDTLIADDLKIGTRTLEEIAKDIETKFHIIMKYSMEGFPPVTTKPIYFTNYKTTGNSTIETAFYLVEIIIFEALINIKKHAFDKIQLAVDFEDRGGLLWVIMNNNSDHISDRRMKRLNKHKIYSTRGLALIDYVARSLSNALPIKTLLPNYRQDIVADHIFSLAIPLGSIIYSDKNIFKNE